jgi:hypothetical protein
MVKEGRMQARKQSDTNRLRPTGATLLWVLILLVVGGMYLAVNARSAKAGREVITLETQREELLRTRAGKLVDLAERRAPDWMLDRAYSMGFREAKPDEVVYLVVDQYQPEVEFVAPSPPSSIRSAGKAFSPDYTETLGDWLSRWLGVGE